MEFDKSSEHYFGIDPGLSGVVAEIMEDGQIRFSACPTRKTGPKGRRENYIPGMAELGYDLGYATFGYLEKVTSNAVQYAGAAFTFGGNYWLWRGMLEIYGVAFELITPQAWKKVVGLPKGSKKNDAIALALELYPDANIGKNHNKADALLMAEAARRHLACE